MDTKIYIPKYIQNGIENEKCLSENKITPAGSTPNLRSYNTNIAIPCNQNVEHAREWVEYDKL